MRLATLLFVLAAALSARPSAAQPVACVDGAAGDHACANATLLAHLPLQAFSSQAGNDIWGWTDPVTGREYALMGLADGIGFVDVSDPTTPVYLGKLPTHTVATIWRDVKVLGDYAFVVSEAENHGMQVFDLARLRDVAPTQAPMEFEADAHYDTVGQSHNVFVNEATATAFIVGNRGPQGCAGGLHMVDVSNPLAPEFAGCFAEDGYTHDVQCVIYDGPDADYRGQELCFAANEDTVTIADVTDRESPTMLSQAIYPNTAYTHQGWLTEDHRFFIANDELDEQRYNLETRTLIFDVSDLDEPEFVGTYLSGLPAVDHNLYIRGDAVYEANYRSGLRVLDASNVAEGELREVAFFDSFPNDNAAQFGGAWSTYPFFKSGTTLISDMQGGLFLVRIERPEPLMLEALDAFAFGGGVDLAWTLSEGEAVEQVTVQRLIGDTFADAGTVRAAPGRASYRYRVTDAPVGEQTFRLRAVDASGMTVYSEPVTVEVMR